jgi:HSP20 family protein
MATDNEQSNTTKPTKEEERSSQPAGLTRKPQTRGITRRQPSSGSGFPLTPYEMFSMAPFSLFRRLTEEFDRALQPFLSEGESTSNVAWIPTVEISERDGNYRILAELPGLSPNEVRVEVDDDAVILQGERQVEREANEGGIRRSERQFGMFYRRIPLPEGADLEHAKAKFHDGILEITMPAPNKQTERRQIQVEADSKPSSDASKHAA